jgi:hypothetical protein
MDQAEPGRLAIWRLRSGRDDDDEFQLEIDLGYDWGLTLKIGPDGHTVTTLSHDITEWLRQAQA